MSMASGDTDFNLSDEVDDKDQGDTAGKVVHAGDDDDDQGNGEELDRGDVVVVGEEGDPDKDAAAAAASLSAAAEAAGGDPLDPAFLAGLAGEEGGKPPAMVPYSRLAEVSAQNQKLMNVIEGITSGKFTVAAPAPAAAAAEAEPAFDMMAKIKARNAALLEGDEDKAAEIELAIEEHRNTTFAAKVRADTLAEINATAQANTLETIVADAFGKFPFLNSNDESYNAEALDEVMMFRNHYVSKGDTLPVAIQKAIDKVCPTYVEVVDETPEDKLKREAAEQAAIAAGGRDPKKVVRNARAAAAQPAAITQAGVANREAIDTNKLDFENMPDDDYDKLPESVKAQARGDIAA